MHEKDPQRPWLLWKKDAERNDKVPHPEVVWGVKQKIALAELNAPQNSVLI